MTKNKLIEAIAKRMYEYQGSEFEVNLNDRWKDLPHDRDWASPYSLSKREYFRMAKGVYKLLKELEK